MKSPYCIKICSKCNRLLVANSMNFAKEKNGKYGFESKCKECKNKYNKQWREANPEYGKQWREANPEYNKQWVSNNREHKAAYNKQWNKDNKEHIAEYGKQWREANPEYNKHWNKNNRERKRKANHKRKAKLKSNGGEYTLEQWQECLEFFDYKCAYSGVELNKDNTNVEHIIPISKGGTNNITNIVPALNSVNFSKGGKDMLSWYKEQPYFSEERLQRIYEWQEYASNKYELNQ